MSELDKLRALVLAQQMRLELTEPFYQQHLACDPRLDYDHASGRLMYDPKIDGMEPYCCLAGEGDSLQWYNAHSTSAVTFSNPCLGIDDGWIRLTTCREDGGRFPCFIEMSTTPSGSQCCVRMYALGAKTCNQSLVAEAHNREQLIIAAKAKGIPIEDHRTSNALEERFHYFLK